jgi:hypothetical protein
MIISKKRKFIFIRGIKTGSTSLQNALSPYGEITKKGFGYKLLRRLPPANRHWRYSSKIGAPHLSTARIKELLPFELFDTALKFGIIRDPLTWNLSVYKHWSRIYRDSEYHKVPDSVRSFEDFLLFRKDEYLPLQMLHYVDLAGDVMIDDLGKFEELEAYQQSLEGRLNLTLNVKYLNQSPDRQVVTPTAKERSLVESLCHIDYEVYNTLHICAGRQQIETALTGFKTELSRELSRAGGLSYDPWVFCAYENRKHYT